MQSHFRNTSYNWVGVLEFLQGEYEKNNQKENIWLLEKKSLQNKISELQGELKAANLIATDLMKRNKMLQYCLRQQKSKAGKQLSIQEVGLDLPPIPQRKPRSNKSNLSKILTSLGIKDIFQQIEREVNLNTIDANSIKNLNFQKQIKQIASNDSNIPVISSNPYKPIQTLLGHNDGVRDIHFANNLPIMVSVSEDCLLKVWDINDFGNPDASAYATIRSHEASLFTITGSDQLMFTGGMDGVVKAWSIPGKAEMDQNKCQRGSWENQSKQGSIEPVWQLLYDAEKKHLYSTTADDIVKMYQISERRASDKIVNVSAEVKQTYRNQSKNQRHMITDQIISAICFPSFRSNSLAVGFLKNHELLMFDKQTAKIINSLKFNAVEASMNKMISFPGFLVSGHEDRFIRIFDNNKMTHSFVGHTDSVSSLAMLSNGVEFMSSSHDGTVKQWDIRKWSCIIEHKSHLTKQDQSVHCLSAHRTRMICASGGADSIIKIYGPSD